MIRPAAVSLVAAVDWHHGEIGTGWWIVMMVLMVVFWAAVIAAMIWLVRAAAVGGVERRAPGPKEVLERRLAAGEIGIEEYERVSAALDRSPVGSPP